MASLNEQRRNRRTHCVNLALQVYDRYTPEARRGMLASFAGAIANSLSLRQLEEWEQLLEDNVLHGEVLPEPH